jgi:hypothetical protein
MCPVAPVQLVLRDRGDGSEGLDAVENATGRDVDELESADPSVHVLRLGTESFIRLVAALQGLGVRAVRFEFRDRRMHPLDDEETDEVAEHLLAALKADDVQGALRYLNREAEDVFIVAITVSGPSSRRFRLGQFGSITGFNSSPEQLISALKTAWLRVQGR